MVRVLDSAVEIMKRSAVECLCAVFQVTDRKVDAENELAFGQSCLANRLGHFVQITKVVLDGVNMLYLVQLL